MFFAQTVCHLKEKRKAALNSLTESYVSVLISFSYYAPDN